MNLENLTANIRPLPPYKALDLGFAIARAWFLPLWGLWLKGIFTPTFLLILLLFGYRTVVSDNFSLYLSLIALIIWLFKPLYEYNLLVFLSQKLFDDSIKAEHFNPYKSLSLQQIFALFLSKFSSQRILKMAVTHLEGQTGKARTTRLRALSRGGGNALIGSLLIFWLMEWSLIVGGWLFLVELLGFDVLGYERANWIFEAQALPNWFLGLCFLIFVLVESVIAPFFVASAFSFYVCRRSLLEGWDIELSFRHLMGRFLQSRTGEKR